MLSLEEIVRAIERGLADPDSGPAGTAWLSRHHFAHLVSASIGEPPGALRRRVLLERAAWRLATSSSPVIEVAIEAGYESPDAFGRAFRAAHRTTPSGFRDDRRSDWTIASANHIHFHPPGGLTLPSTRRSTTMDVLVRMYDHHVGTTAAILDRLAAVGDRIDEPISSSVEGIDRDPTLRSLGDRLVAQLEMWVTAVGGGTALPAGADDPDALRARLAAAAPAFRRLVVEEVAAGRAETVFVDATCEPPRTFTLGGVLAHVLTFAAVRRTMAIGALETAGVDDLGSGDPMRAVGGEGEDAARIRRTRR